VGRSRGQPTRGRSRPGCLPTLIRHPQPAARAAQTAARTASRKHTPANDMAFPVQSNVADSSLIGECFCVKTGGTAPPASAVPPPGPLPRPSCGANQVSEVVIRARENGTGYLAPPAR
jgi:hypothetical protein